jgi:hypothetical protein
MGAELPVVSGGSQERLEFVGRPGLLLDLGETFHLARGDRPLID